MPAKRTWSRKIKKESDEVSRARVLDDVTYHEVHKEQ